MMNWLKKVNNIKTTDTSGLVKKVDYDTKIGEIEKKLLTDHGNSNKYIYIQKLNRLTADNFADRLKQANLVSKNDIVDFVKNMYFDDKLININKKVTLNKRKYVLIQNKLNKLSEKIDLISTKESTNDLINKYSIFNGRKYFSSDLLQNYLVFTLASRYISTFKEINKYLFMEI